MTKMSVHCLEMPQFARSLSFTGHSCSVDQLSCLNGECVKSSHRCDGEAQCLDASDEMDCSCLLGEFSCMSSKDCVPISNVCDGKNQCPDGSDEMNCGKSFLFVRTRLKTVLPGGSSVNRCCFTSGGHLN